MYAIQEKYGIKYFAGWDVNSAHEPIIIWNKMNEGYICCWNSQSMAIEYMKTYHKWFTDEFYKFYKVVKI